ncbi:hypothetical protein ACWD5F_00290 [Streptomyces sp. NPDC002499]
MGRIGNAYEYAKKNPGEIATVGAAAVVAGVTVVDLFGLLSVSEDFLSRTAILLLSALIITLPAVRKKQEDDRREIKDRLFTLTERVKLLGPGSQAAELPSHEIRKFLDEALQTASYWHFRGGLGNWQRSTVLPKLSAITVYEVDYFMQIIDPRDMNLCARYSEYRMRSRQRTPREDSSEVRNELLANIYAAAWYKKHTRLNPRISLLSFYSPLRYDASDHALITTVADPESPGLRAPSGGWYYLSILDEIKQTREGAPRVILPRTDSSFPRDWRSVEAGHVEDALNQVKVAVTGRPTRNLLDNQTSNAGLNFARIAELAFQGRTE